jgi:hypothetical protein
MKTQFIYTCLTQISAFVPQRILRTIDWNKTKGFYSNNIKILLILCAAFLLPTTLNAEPIKPNMTNIGFMKNPPQKLKKKFPMCDAFLKVTWIDKKKKIGYSEFNRYDINGIKDKKEYLTLIYLEEYEPNYYFDIRKWHKNLPKLFSLIKQGNIELYHGEYRLIITNLKGEKTVFPPTSSDRGFITDRSDRSGFSFSNELINVCIPYPDNQRMWIAEMKDPKKIYSKQEINEINTRVSILVPNFSIRKQYAVFDFNFDGVDDYFGMPTLISNGTQYFETLKPMWERQIDDNYGQFYMSQTKKVCDTIIAWDSYLTTDGTSYFFNNICNLTTGE